MDTAPLKSFATWARTALIREVTARIAAVLAPGSSERVEHTIAVAALEKAIAAASGGDKGRGAVADKVAYIWFNRIIALRFMDANSYTGSGVVSPQAGVEVGQPEILAQAKRGVIDFEVISQTTRAAVVGLLDGTRASGDAQGEAYALLLADYCRHWNRAMPFMFEREGDFTELLIPANLLADDSVLNRAVNVLTKEVCKDVEVIGWLYQFYISERKGEVFAGFMNGRKAGPEEIPAATQLFTPHWIVRYLVENSLGHLWMLNRPSSGLVSKMDYYIAPVDEETDFLEIRRPEDLTVIDPACGSGHMLTYAFDLLYAIYEEEGYGPAEIPGLILTNNLFGTEIDPRAGALAAFALAMKARAKQRTFFTNETKPNICVIEPISFTPDELTLLATRQGDPDEETDFWNQFAMADTVGSLIRPDGAVIDQLANHVAPLDHSGDVFTADVIERAHRVVAQARFLLSKYAVAVANPPYMGSKGMGAELAAFAKASFPASKADLYAMFIDRCAELVVPLGRVGMITMQSWMFIGSFRAFRQQLLDDLRLESMVHLGTGAFESITGEVVSTVAWVMQRAEPSGRTTFVRAVDLRGDGKRAEMLRVAAHEPSDRRFVTSQSALAGLPGSPIVYWLGDRILEAFARFPSIGSRFEIRVGMQTSNNAKYLRLWWEPSFASLSETRAGLRAWITYAKGGPFRRWTGNLDSVLHFNFDPNYILAQPNATVLPMEALSSEKVSWTHMSPGRVSFRLLPADTFHDIGGHAIYVSERDSRWVLGYLNSRFVGALVEALNPTVNIQTSDIARIPVLDFDTELIASLAGEAVEISSEDERTQETDREFERPQIVEGALRIEVQVQEAKDYWTKRRARLLEIEDQIEDVVASAAAVAADKTDRQIALFNRPDDEIVWSATQISAIVSYAVGCMFGRFSLDEPGLILADQGSTLQDYLAKVPSPSFLPDKDNVIPFVDGDWFEDDILGRFRQFLRVAFGAQHFEENLRFVTESLGVKNLRDYFVKSFYKDHVQRYKKRPIYWLFSSPKGSFNALVYMHRYTPSTVSTVLNEYLREFQAKLKASLEHAERSNNAREADRLRKVLLELDGYEHDTLYPLASQNVAIDLDDGVKANYPKFGDALKKIPGLEASE